MIILGIHDGHNCTASLLIDGRVVGCVSEERFSRLKNDAGHPSSAIECLLKKASIGPDRIDFVALATKEAEPVGTIIRRDALFTVSDYIKEMHEYWKPKLYDGVDRDYKISLLDIEKFHAKDSPYDVKTLRSLPEKARSAKFNDERIRLIQQQLGIGRDRIKIVDHHRGHAYYAYYASSFHAPDNAAIVTADGWGDGCNATISTVRGGRITEIYRTGMCNMARLYRWTTLLLGMKPNEHEYKVMGLAPYAKTYVRDQAYRIYKDTLAVDGLDFKWVNKPRDMYFHFKERLEGVRFDGIAAGLQLWLEDMLSEWITNIMTKTGSDAVYYSGGLSMNVKANKTIAELNTVKKLYVPPSGADESLAIGAAYVIAEECGDRPETLCHAYLGSEPDAHDSLEAVRCLKGDSRFLITKDVSADRIAGLLVAGKVLGRCVGAMEFGARSLGNRAIICDPSKFENLRIINEKIKFRDFWMPFTPSILAERADDYIINPKRIMADYMTIAYDSTSLARDHLKAAIHPHDFSVRPQLVSRTVNDGYYGIIKAFEKRTGVGALLNTSLNLHGHPMACTAGDAVFTLINSGLDGMILPGFLVLRSERADRKNENR